MFKIKLSDGRSFEVEAPSADAAKVKAYRIERVAAILDVVPV